jgi:large subunit ribosomal protein L4
LHGALSDRARDGLVHVVESFVTGETPSTKAAIVTLRKATESSKVLVVLSSTDELNWLSLRNETTVHLIEAGQLNTYDVLVADEVVFTKDALDEFLGVPAEASEEGNK